MKKKLIFYQSIAEISEIIELLKKNAVGKFLIIVTGGKQLTNLLKKLKLKKKYGLKIYEFHTPRLINPLNIIKICLILNYSKESKKVLNYYFEDVIFFSYGYDFITPFFLSKINSQKITFINYYKRKFIKGSPGFKEILQILIVKFILMNNDIKIFFHKNYRQIFYLQKNKKIDELPPQNIYLKSIFKLPISKEIKNKKIIIFFDAYEEVLVGAKFKEVLFEIFKLLEAHGYLIIIKKHPVSNLSKSISNSKKWLYILDPFPIEMYKLNSVRFVFGLYSLSLIKVIEKHPNIKAFSFSRLIEKKNLSNTMKNNLKKMGIFSKIDYPRNLKEIKKIINT